MTEPMDPELQQIRQRLRLAMNGVISASMREKGNVYKLNFGVPIPELRQIAQAFTPRVELAEAMWQEEVRELKILATLLYPREAMDEATALRWIRTIPYPEIAEQVVFNLLRHLPFAYQLAIQCLQTARDTGYERQVGFLLLGHLGRTTIAFPLLDTPIWLNAAQAIFNHGKAYERLAALTALKNAGRDRDELKEHILHHFSAYQTSDSPFEREIYDALAFEFDYSDEKTDNSNK